MPKAAVIPTKTLIIAEKPSVASDLARVLGRIKKQGDFYESEEYLISSAVGHLVELFMPEDIDKKKYGFWRLEPLPIIPDKFGLKPITERGNKDQFALLKKLLKRKDVKEVINACDAGREGELIFTYIYEAAKCKLPVRRLWMQSMTTTGIKEAFQRLREGDQMLALQDAARCRSEADWLIGINGTRAVTVRMLGSRRSSTATVGRVQTPTLTLVVERERLIRDFQPRTYWRIEGYFGITGGTYKGLYQRPEFKKSEDEHDKIDRLWKEESVEAIVSSLQDLSGERPVAVTEKKKRSRQSAPRLYDLTTLQREANNRYGLPARRTLSLAQSLYEKHKVLTYPRTDSRALPQDYPEEVRRILGELTSDLGDHARKVLENDWVRPGDKRVFNNAQVSDHFAIIPTGKEPGKLTDDERKIYDMATRRFVATFFPPAEFDVTTRMSEVAGHTFKSEGKVLVAPGWLDVYGDAGKQAELPALQKADFPHLAAGAEPRPEDVAAAQLEEVTPLEEQTKPPARFTEATLLTAMETAGRLVEDEELAEAMKEKGLGTPATRAQTIEHLVNEKYLERQGRELHPTTKADTLIEFLHATEAATLTSPDLTGEWEHRLHQIEQGILSRDAFMEQIKGLTNEIVGRVKNFEEDRSQARETAIISPSDNKPMRELLRHYESQDGEVKVYKTIGNRKLSEEEVCTLLKEGRIGPLDGFRSKRGKAFSAVLYLDESRKVKFDFGGDGEDGNGDGQEIDLTQLRVIGKSPKDQSPVYEAPNAYGCATALKGGPDRAKGFRMGRTLLGKTIPPEQVVKLLEEGKTELIKGFRSNRTKRLFDAFLVIKNGDVKFEFDNSKRPPKKKRTAKKTS